MNAKLMPVVPIRGWETEDLKTSSRSNTTSRWISGAKVLGLIIVGLCALRTKFDSVLLKDSKGKSPNSSRGRKEISFAASEPMRPATPAHLLPASLPRGRRVVL